MAMLASILLTEVAPLSAQQPEVSEIIQVDLSQQGSSAIAISAEKRYRLLLLFALPGIRYSVSEVVAVQEVVALPPFPEKSMRAVCPIKAAYQAIASATSEAAVKPSVQVIQRTLAAPPESACTEQELRAGREAVEKTTREWILGPYQRGRRVTLTITRVGIGDGAAPTWQRILATPADGAWEITYGFGFLWQQWMPPDRYFVHDSADVYVIAAARDRRKLSFSPTLLFRWADPLTDGAGVVWDRMVGGIGVTTFDGSNPFVALATGVTYRRNLSLHVGMAVHGVQRLRDEYSAQQVLRENLEEEQLHERALAINPYLSISLRLSTNPFGTDDDAKRVEPAPADQPPRGEHPN